MIRILPYSKTQTGQTVHRVILKNSSGMEAHFLTYGVILQRLLVPAGTGLRDVVLGFDDLKSYEQDSYYLGRLVGRNANRIANAQCTLDGKEVKLSANEGVNQLHGGFKSFGDQIWEVTNLGDAVLFTYISPDGEEGFPGRVQTQFYAQLKEDHTLVMRMEATTDKETIINLTRHEYFNLNAASLKGVQHHKISIDAQAYLPTDGDNIPTGIIEPVKDTAFDLNEPTLLKEALVHVAGGYDHNFVLRENRGQSPAAQVIDSEERLSMKLHCTHPGLQFFTASTLQNFKGRHGVFKDTSPGLCLEPQYFPDAPHHDHFPSTVLKPGERYAHNLNYSFIYE